MKERLKHLLNTGDRLALSIGGPGGMDLTLETSLKDLDSLDRLVVQASALDGTDRLKPGDPIRLTVSKETSGMLEMDGYLVRCTASDSTLLLVVELTEDIRQHQRRQFFRLPILREIHLGLKGDNPGIGMTQNISAGGLRCVYGGHLRVGASVAVRLELNRELFELSGEVLESALADDTGQNHVLRIRFTEVSEKEQQRLISLLFREQSRRR